VAVDLAENADDPSNMDIQFIRKIVKFHISENNRDIEKKMKIDLD
jgi:hypothetical protein